MKARNKAIAWLTAFAMMASVAVTNMPLSVNAAEDENGFVETDGTKFTLDGSDFYYAGTNNYYINFKPADDVDEVMKDAQDMGLTVIRTWGHLDAGTLTDEVDEDGFPIFENNVDGSGHKEGVYYQYWDAQKNKPIVNHGEYGLQKLDYVISQAEKHNIKMIITLTNYWDAFGGMGQYCLWAGKSKSAVEDFYSDETIKSWFKNYINEVLNHKNVYTGRKLMDEPAIFAWELANEPRYNAQDKALEDNDMYEWASEISAYIKSIDKNHMVAVGDEGGMYYNEYSNHAGANTIPADETVDTGKQHWHGGMGNFHHIMQIDTIDFGTPHLYPGVWGMGSEPELKSWLKLHADVAHEEDKPIILEEFGWSNKEVAAGVTPYAAGRDTFFEYIYDAMLDYEYAGSNFWMLGAHTLNDAVGYYPDYDGFTVYNFEGPVSADGKERYGTNEIIIEHATVMNNKGDKNKLSVNKTAYDKANPSICSVTVTPQTGAKIASVAIDGNTVTQGTAYSLSNNKIKFMSEYLNLMDEGTYYVTIKMTKGMSLQLTLEVSDSSIASAVAGKGTYIFDKNPNASKDVVIPVTVNDGGAFKGVYVLDSSKTKITVNSDAYTVSNNNVTIKADYLANKDIGDLNIILDYKKGTDPIVKITITDTTGKDIVDNFEVYSNDTSLNKAWSRNTSGGTVSGSLVTGQNNSVAMKYSFDLGSSGYAGITKAVNGLAVTGFDGVSFWIKAEKTTKNDITIQLREPVSDYNSIYWEKIYKWSDLNAANGTKIEIPFEEFSPKASSYNGISQPEAGQVCGDNAVSEFSIYVGGSDNNNSFVIDDIMLYSENKAAEDESTEQESTEEQSTEQESTEEQSTEEQSTEQESTQEQSTEQESSEDESTEQESTEEQSTEQESIEEQSTEEESPETEGFYAKVEFEDVKNYEQNGSNKVASDMFADYSGSGYVYLQSGWGEVKFDIPRAGKYKITLVTNADCYKENWLYIDNDGAGVVRTSGNTWSEHTAEFNLTKGNHKFGVSSNWGYVALDYVIIEEVQ